MWFKGATSEPDDGYYVPPTVFADVPLDSPLAQEEIFGPVLCVFRASNFEEALEIAMNSQFALTGGVFSRNPRNIAVGASSVPRWEPVHQPQDHRRGRRAPAVRGAGDVGSRREGGRAGLRPAVHGPASSLREHGAPGVRAGGRGLDYHLAKR